MKLNRIYNIDAVEWLKKLESNSIDLIVTDPPYRLSKWGSCETSMQGVLAQNWNKIFEFNDIHIKDYIFELYRVLKEDSHLYIMVNTYNLQEFLNSITEVKFKIHNLLVWKKSNTIANRYYMKNCEYTIFAYKWKAKNINFCSSQSVHSFKNPIKGRKHPTQKPIKLMELYIKNSSKPWEIVLDPFAGVGTTLLASQKLDRDYLGFELDKNYFEIAKNDLERERIKLEIKNNNLKSFIRKKKINWNSYYYEVCNYRDKESWKVRQRVIKYLGKNHPVDK